jgi:hypothetical protein
VKRQSKIPAFRMGEGPKFAYATPSLTLGLK